MAENNISNELIREQNAVGVIGQIKNTIKTVAENKNIEVLDSDNALSVLDKIDRFDGGDYEIESVLLEDGTQQINITDAEKTVKVGGRAEPAVWKQIRETLHTNELDQFFLVGSGLGSDNISLYCYYPSTISVYGGKTGTELLFQDSVAAETTWNLLSRDITTYPLPEGLTFSKLKGKYYYEIERNISYELISILVHTDSSNPPPCSIGQGVVNPPILEFAGPSRDYMLKAKDNYINGTRFLQFIFLAYNSNYKKIGDYAFEPAQNCRPLFTDITIPEGITSIGKSTFTNTSLETFNLPTTLEILNGFNYDNSLKKLVIPASVKEIDTISAYKVKEVFFQENSQLQTLNNFNSFYELEKINLPNTITYSYNSFNNCYRLEEITVPNGTSTSLSYNYNLKKLLIPVNISFQTLNLSQVFSLEYIESEINKQTFGIKISNATKLKYFNCPNLKITENNHYFRIFGHDGYNYICSIGLYPEIEDSESPVLKLKTPILIDYKNSFNGLSRGNIIQLDYCCLKLDHLKSIFDWLPVVSESKTMKCGNQYQMDLTTGELSPSSAFNDFLEWYNTLPDTDPGDGTIWKKGWTVIE